MCIYSVLQSLNYQLLILASLFFVVVDLPGPAIEVYVDAWRPQLGQCFSQLSFVMT